MSVLCWESIEHREGRTTLDTRRTSLLSDLVEVTFLS